jgi:ATP-dependent helicase/nuclease subunit A
MSGKKIDAPDEEQRKIARAERRANVIIDAGPGTGKTTLVVERFVALVAPEDDALPALDIARVVAITFTRRAAGSLRLRLRKHLLAEQEQTPSPVRRARLAAALAGLDAAHVGTIHAFADRLLRRLPAATSLSPSYRIVEDASSLVHETFEALLAGAESGTLSATLPEIDRARAQEAEATWRDARRAGVRADAAVGAWQVRHGLRSLVDEFCARRDAPPRDPDPAPFALGPFAAAADELLRHLEPLAPNGTVGVRWLLRLRGALRELRGRAVDDPLIMLRTLGPIDARAPNTMAQRAVDFGDDQLGWDVFRAWRGDDRESRIRTGSLRAELLGPLHRWLAVRLVRSFPVVTALYARVKARHAAVDQLDLLLALRDALRDDLGARAACQARFDHVFVDEFQDTDPLQAEIVLYLCERTPPIARDARDVELTPGKLTIVGDPKQSIYRFRRADIATYDEARGIVNAQPQAFPRVVRLSSSFRAAPSLLAWGNDRFARVLGADPSRQGRHFDVATGEVFHAPLEAAVAAADAPPGARVHILRFQIGAGPPLVDRYRALEGKTLARWLRWLVDTSGESIRDPHDKQLRPVRFGDVAILAITTTSLPLLFPALDAQRIPYAARGGVLFLTDPVHRQLLLALRALSDPDDGPAQAALYRPPFFAIDLGELATHAPVVQAARALVGELARERGERPFGETARALLERTAFARLLALGPNGAQRLARVRELVHVLETRGDDEGLDYDGVSALARAWVDDPIPCDAPAPVGGDAVQILTVHQAKGLEFPAVVLWDSRAPWQSRPEGGAFRSVANGWMIDLDGLAWEEPAGLGLRERERKYRDAERKRLVFVAATRARDLLAVPRGGLADTKWITGALAAPNTPIEVRVFDEWREDRPPPAWAAAPAPEPPPPSDGRDGAELAHAITSRWEEAALAAAAPRARPIGVTTATHVEDDAIARPRHGADAARFGDLVHRALAAAIGAHAVDAASYVRAAALIDPDLPPVLVTDAVADTARALAAIRASLAGAELACEVPIAGAGAGASGGTLVGGYIDLLAASRELGLTVIDFKTDVPPTTPGVVHASHAAQVREYARLLVAAGVASDVRCGILYTMEDRIRFL